MTDPWSGIGTPDRDFNVVKIARTPIPMFWGRDEAGRCLLIVEFTSDFSAEFHRQTLKVNGLEISLRAGGSSLQRLVVALDRAENQDLFSVLCHSLLATLMRAESEVEAFTLVFGHLRRWKAFLVGGSAGLLADWQIRGLFAELTFLGRLMGRFGPDKAVLFWCGPEKLHQDFIFSDSGVEVKSLSGRERNSVRISSEDQLEAAGDRRLFLWLVSLTDGMDFPEGVSLNELIRRIDESLNEPESIDRFHTLLRQYGYAPRTEYDVSRFKVQREDCFKVVNGFPRLTRARLPAGIMRVSYEIALEAIEQYRCPAEDIF